MLIQNYLKTATQVRNWMKEPLWLQLLMPGSQEEMTKFQDDTVSSSKLHIECTFPRLDVNLHTKDVFENIYNRWVRL